MSHKPKNNFQSCSMFTHSDLSWDQLRCTQVAPNHPSTPPSPCLHPPWYHYENRADQGITSCTWSAKQLSPPSAPIPPASWCTALSVTPQSPFQISFLLFHISSLSFLREQTWKQRQWLQMLSVLISWLLPCLPSISHLGWDILGPGTWFMHFQHSFPALKLSMYHLIKDGQGSRDDISPWPYLSTWICISTAVSKQSTNNPACTREVQDTLWIKPD